RQYHSPRAMAAAGGPPVRGGLLVALRPGRCPRPQPRDAARRLGVRTLLARELQRTRVQHARLRRAPVTRRQGSLAGGTVPTGSMKLRRSRGVNAVTTVGPVADARADALRRSPNSGASSPK